VGCNCQKRHDDRSEEVFRLLEAIDLRPIGEQVTAIPETMTSARRYLAKAERAERLGLGADVSTLYRQAAERPRPGDSASPGGADTPRRADRPRRLDRSG
jgi:hypothetical protein